MSNPLFATKPVEVLAREVEDSAQGLRRVLGPWAGEVPSVLSAIGKATWWRLGRGQLRWGECRSEGAEEGG